MKLIAVLLLMPFLLFSQTTPSKDNLYEIVSSGTDTLATSTTLTFEFEKNDVAIDFTNLYEYSFTVTSDSISGANAGTVALQVSNSANDDTSPTWFTYDTETIDSAPQQIFHFEGLIRSRRIRLLITSPSGTRVTIVTVEGTAKRVK